MFLFHSEDDLRYLSYGYFEYKYTTSCASYPETNRSLIYKNGRFKAPLFVDYWMSSHQAEMYMYWITILDNCKWVHNLGNIRVGPFTIVNGRIAYESINVEPCEPFEIRYLDTEVKVRNCMLSIPLPRFLAASLAINGGHLEY